MVLSGRVSELDEVLAECPRRDGRDLVFGYGEGGFQGWSKSKATLDRVILAARLNRHGKNAPVLQLWRLHDIRRTCATGMADKLGVLPHVVEAVLGHTSGHRAGVAATYNKATYGPEKAMALTAWAGRVRAIVDAIKECAAASMGNTEIETVSEHWRQSRTYKDREVCFINRPIVLGDEVDVRKFYAFDRNGKLVAFSFFDPIYQDRQVVGYSTSFKRRLPESDPFICAAILQSAIDAFRLEGRKWLFLGLSPMADIEDKGFKHSAFISFNFRHAYRCPLFNRFIYPVQAHAAHKREYRGLVEQTYFAFNTGLALPRLLKLLRACNMI
jgi:hypothetical protein